MTGEGQPNVRKRLRVRIRAANPIELAGTLGPFLSEDGAFLLTPARLAVATPVVFEVAYADGRLALSGEGEVLGVRSTDPGPAGLILGLKWSGPSLPTLKTVLAERTLFPPDAAEDEDLWNERSTIFLGHEEVTAIAISASAIISSPPNDLISDLMPPPDRVPADTTDFLDDARQRLRGGPSTEYAYASDEVSHDEVVDPELKEQGDVATLARIELVRQYSPTVRTGDFPAPSLDGHLSSFVPSKKQRPELGPKTGPTVAIDLGSSSVRMAFAGRDGQATPLLHRSGAVALPSVVVFEPGGKTLVGEAAQARMSKAPDRGVTRIGRLLAMAYASPRLADRALHLGPELGAAEETEAAIRIGDHLVSFEELAALLLKEATHGASKAIGTSVNRVLLTCPASYGQRQRVGLITASLLAGLHVEAVVSAPLSAVHGFAMDNGLELGRFLVVDIGGGITDVAVIELEDGIVSTLSSGGDLSLGGIDFDVALGRALEDELHRRGAPESDLETKTAIHRAAELAKWALADNDQARMVLPAGPRHGVAVEVTIDRAFATRALAPLFERINAVVGEVLIRAGVEARSLDGVLLLGAQGTWPLAQQALATVMGAPTFCRDPQHLAALGAARLAALLDRGESLPLVEALSASVGVGTGGGGVAMVLGRDHPLPAEATYVHRVASDDDLEIYLFQGDQRRVELDEPLARLRIIEAPDPFPRPYQVRLEIGVDPNGPISARAIDTESGRELELVDVPEITRQQIDARHGSARASSTDQNTGIFSKLMKRLRGQEASD